MPEAKTTSAATAVKDERVYIQLRVPADYYNRLQDMRFARRHRSLTAAVMAALDESLERFEGEAAR